MEISPILEVCIKKNLFRPLIYICTKKEDFITPFIKLFGLYEKDKDV